MAMVVSVSDVVKTVRVIDNSSGVLRSKTRGEIRIRENLKIISVIRRKN